MLSISSKIISQMPNNVKRITEFLSNYCSQTKILHKLHKFRNKLLLQSSTQAWKGYQVLCEQAKNQANLYNQDLLLKEGLSPPVPGLIHIPNILPPETLLKLTKNSQALYQLLGKHYKMSTSSHKSFNHNLSEDKSYKLLNIQDLNSKNGNNQLSEHEYQSQSQSQSESQHHKNKNIDCQMFADYGSVNHDLIYFIDNKNIPRFVWDCLVKKLEENSLVKQLIFDNELNWRLTLNVYKKGHSQQEDQTAFMWHKDIPVNGIITSITTIMGDGYFQIRDQANEKINYKIKLVPGSIVILSGEARWRWIHRVIRIPTQSSDSEVQRISLVLGCK